MKNIKIKYRIFFISIVALVGMLAFSGYLVVDKRQVASEMESLNKLAKLGPVVSAVVHELQKERGTSAGFIGSKGARFAKELPAQREVTDEKRAALAAALDSFDSQSYGAGLVAKVEAAQSALAELEGKRTQVSAFELTVPRMAGYYTPTIAKLLSIVEEMSVLSSDAQVTNAITAYTTFLQAKERAGIERAMGAAGFGAGEFKPPVYRRFLQLIAMQETFLDTFAIYATPEQRALFEATVTGEAVNEVERMRKVAIESPITSSTGGIEGTQWFATITEKIELLKTVEDRIASDLAALTAGIYDGAQSAFYMVAVLSVTLLAATLAISFFIVQGIVTPVRSMTEAMGRLADGDKSVEIPAQDRQDEIGEMAAAVQVFKDNAIRMEEMAKEQAEADRQKAAEVTERQREAEERAKRLDELIQAFDAQVTTALETVSSAATEMQATAQSMSATAEESSRQSTAVATASEQASSNVQTVATAAEELSTSIAEISNQVAQSAKIAEEAVREAERTNSTVQGLAEAAGKIGDVVGLINDIAGQTNLLALNATIEAARAGEAGKGFAVVASEVKNLANQTAKATNEISGQIGDIQAATEGAVGAIQGIGATIAKINGIASSIASAVEEQGAATSEISRNVQEAAKGTQEVSDNITGVTEAAVETGSAANQVLGAAGEMAQQSTTLRQQVESFLTQIRAA